MNKNGRSPTSIEVDGIVFDLNRITKPEYFKVMREIQKLTEDDYEKAVELSGQLFEKIVVSWPFPQPITKEGYSKLGMMDCTRADTAFQQLAEIISKKKSESSLIPPENSNGESVKSLILDQNSPALSNTNMPEPN